MGIICERRRRGHSPEGAPGAHGAHRPRRAGLAHLVLQGRPEPDRLSARHRSRELEKVLLLRGLDRHDGRQRRAQEGPERPRGQGHRGVERIDVDREEALGARGPPEAAARVLHQGQGANFDEDDEFWGRGLSNWAEEAALPPLEEARELVGGLFLEVAKEITTEDSKKIRELVRNTAIRDDRRLTPRELEQVATAAIQIEEALKPLYKQAAKATGSKKGAIKHINKILDALFAGEELEEDDAKLVEGVDLKNLEKARDLGNNLLRDVLEGLHESPEEIREITNDLCLRTDGKIQKEDLDALVQWALKVREMYLDIESRRSDARDAAEDSKRRLETWRRSRASSRR